MEVIGRSDQTQAEDTGERLVQGINGGCRKGKQVTGDRKGHQDICNPVGECLWRLQQASDCQLGE